MVHNKLHYIKFKGTSDTLKTIAIWNRHEE